MTDSDREKRARAALDRYHRCSMAERPVGHHVLDWMLSALEAADEACPVVPLERAQKLEQERDEAVAAARDFAEVLDRIRQLCENDDEAPRTRTELGNLLVENEATQALARHPSFLRRQHTNRS